MMCWPTYTTAAQSGLPTSRLRHRAPAGESATESPWDRRCQNTGSGIVLLISLRKDSVMGRSWDKEQKELTDC